MTDFKVIRLNQNSKDLFVGTISGQQLIELPLRVDSWEDWIGYQRKKSTARANRIMRFLLNNKGIMPTSILASIRAKRTKFIPISGSFGRLVIPKSAHIYIVDGQHRIEGLKKAATKNVGYRDYNYPVVFMCPAKWGSKYQADMEEGKQFVTINKTQVKVPSDLVDTMLWSLKFYDQSDSAIAKESLPVAIYMEMKVRAKALTLANYIRDYQNWKGKIRFANEPKGQTLIKQSFLVDTLVDEILTTPPYDTMTVQELALRLDDYWTAVLDFYPEAVTHPESYYVQRRLGVAVFNRLFATVDGATNLPKSTLEFSEALRGLSMKEESFWGPRGQASELGTSFKSVQAVSAEIAQRITQP